MSEPLLVQLVRTLARPITESDRARARLHLLDWLACVAGARGWRNKFDGDSLSVDDLKCLLGNVLEMDDVHRASVLHPGPVIWPVVIGVRGRGFRKLSIALDAAIIGYEAMIAIGSTLDSHHYKHYHPTSTAGAFGVAAAYTAMFYRHLSALEVSHSLALAGSVSGGLWQLRHENTDAKQFHVHNACATGRNAAWMVNNGLTGPLSILEGPQGIYAATCRDPKPMTFPDQWRIHDVSFKPWAACRHAHPVIDCALELRARGELTAPFRVETYADAIAFCDRPNPVTEVDAKFSLQHAVAVIASGREARPEDFTPEAIAELAPLRAQVSVTENKAITERYPAHFGARVNGLQLIDTRGDPERPVDEAVIRQKMHTLAAWGGLPSEEAERACALALEGHDAAAISDMLEDWLG